MDANNELQIIESKMLSMLRITPAGIETFPPLIKAITIVSEALDTLTNMSATAKLQIKKYMGECRFLFLAIAAITRMFSSRLTMPSVRNTSVEISSCL